MTCRTYLATAALLSLAAASSPLPAADTVIVQISNFKFQPETITVTPGTTVRWANKDDVDHDVTSGTTITGRAARNADKVKHPDGRFQSGLFGKKGAYTVRFEKTGAYPYFCNIHPFMSGSVVVEKGED